MPLCQTVRKVDTWTSSKVVVCDTRVCQGRGLLRTMERFNNASKRFSMEAELSYKKSVSEQRIDGWMHRAHIQYVTELTWRQHASGVYGAVGEIGVHHGLFFLALAGYSHPQEPLVAIDLFEYQLQNIDSSGKGSMTEFEKNLVGAGIPVSGVHSIRGDSTQMTIRDFTQMNLPAFRMLSVDGGHTLEATVHDLNLAVCSLAEGGIIIIDDISSLEWFGVIQGIVQFLSDQDTVAPFLYGNNKMYLTTLSHHSMYLQYMEERPSTFKCQRDLHVSRVSLGKYRMCLSEYP